MGVHLRVCIHACMCMHVCAICDCLYARVSIKYNFIKLACSVVNMVFVNFNPHGRRETCWLRKKNIWFFLSRLKKQSLKQIKHS